MPDSQVFIVHLWGRESSGNAFRAAVQRVGADETRWFTEATALADYLRRRCDGGAEAEESAARKHADPKGDST